MSQQKVGVVREVLVPVGGRGPRQYQLVVVQYGPAVDSGPVPQPQRIKVIKTDWLIGSESLLIFGALSDIMSPSVYATGVFAVLYCLGLW